LSGYSGPLVLGKGVKDRLPLSHYSLPEASLLEDAFIRSDAG
jgi:hypothetical protein